MDAEKLLDLVKRYRDHKEYITNEETAKMALVVPFIRLLGYDPNNPREVRLEFRADFTQGDGKRLPDRMDFAIFDSTGNKPLMVIETKPLGSNLKTCCQQLARYIGQMIDLHFGIITDGCNYLFYGDLDAPNQMDKEPFFSFSLDDPNTDWVKVGKFLLKFSREAFNAETLVTDAENSRYRGAMIDKLVGVLQSPNSDDEFMRWLTKDIYRGKRTDAVMQRLGDVAREAVEPALLRVISNDFLDKLKERIERHDAEAADRRVETAPPDGSGVAADPQPARADDEEVPGTRYRIETTPEESEFYTVVQSICVREGVRPEEILQRDTVNYFNVSYRRPTRWFLRLFSSGKRKSVVTPVSVDEATRLAGGFQVDAAPPVFGVSRVYIDGPSQMWALKALVLRSLEIVRTTQESPAPEPPTNSAASTTS